MATKTFKPDVTIEIHTARPEGYSPRDVGVAIYRALYRLRTHPDISDKDKEVFKNAMVMVADRTLVKLVGGLKGDHDA